MGLLTNLFSRRSHFRTNKGNGHPSYIYKRKKGKYKYIGITHSERTKRTTNVEMCKNPNKNDNRKSYFIPKSKTDDVKNFKKKKKGWKISRKDKKNMKKYFEK